MYKILKFIFIIFLHGAYKICYFMTIKNISKEILIEMKNIYNTNLH